MSRLLAVAFTVLLVGTLGLAAQPSPGDYVVVESHHGVSSVWALNRLGVVRTLAMAAINHRYAEPRMDVGNLDLVAVYQAWRTGVLSVVRIGASGQVTTLGSTTTLNAPLAIEVDADGSYLLLGYQSSLSRFTASGFTSVANIPASFNGHDMTIDPVTGHYWIIGYPGNLGWVDHRTGAVTTLTPIGCSQPGPLVAHDETTDSLVFACSTSKRIYFVNRQQQVVRSFTTPRGVVSLRMAPGTGHVHALDGGYAVVEFTPAGTPVQTVRLPDLVDLYSFEVYGSRPVSGVGSAARNTVYQLRIGFPAHRGMTYIGALSLGGIGPAIPVPGGRRIALAPDALFRITATQGDIPGLTRGLRGRLSLAGQATVLITIPPQLPRGLRVFASAVVLDPRAPGGLHTGNTWAFEVQ